MYGTLTNDQCSAQKVTLPFSSAVSGYVPCMQLAEHLPALMIIGRSLSG